MKHLTLAICISLFIFVSCTENGNDPNKLGISMEKLYPMTVGNYWVYETVEYDSTFLKPEFIFTDSMVVVEKYKLSGKTAYEVITYRNGAYLEKAFYSVTEDDIYIYGTLFAPLFKADTIISCPLFPEKWKSIISGNNTNLKYDEYSDTLDHQIRVYEQGSKEGNIVDIKSGNEIHWNGQFNLNQLYEFNGTDYKAFRAIWEGTWDLAMYTRECRFEQYDNGCEYLDSNRRIILKNMSFEMVFGKDIGIFKTAEIINYCTVRPFKRERTLLRYRVN